MANHPFRFFRVGGVDQVVLESDADLAKLAELDLKLWTALAMPTRGVDFEPRTLDLIDTDKDGRIRAPEVLAAVAWAREQLDKPADLFQSGDSLEVTDIKEGPVRAGARRILENLGKADAKSVTLADVADTAKIFASTRFNGDGVVIPDCAADEATRKVIDDISATQGTVPDRSGKPGIDKAKAEAFFAQAKAYCTWRARATTETALLPIGEATTEAATAMLALEPKIEEYFTRCQLVAFDPRAAAALDRTEVEVTKPAGLAIGAEDLVRLPIARADTGRALPLEEGINPAYRQQLSAFVQKAAVPLLGKEEVGLSESDWAALKGKLAPYRAWQAAKPVTSVEKLGYDRLKEITSGQAEQAVLALIEKDLALEAENAQIVSVEKLLRLKRDLVRLLRNFVSFSDFYSKRDAAFQAGTLWMDARACELCVEVADAGKHAALAAMSASYLAYCDCSRPSGEKKSIVAAFTDGDSDNLFVGRNGVFFDRKGRDWDATITKVVSNPISIREAFWSPYKKFVRFIEEQVAKRASAAESESTAKLQGAAQTTAHADKTKLEDGQANGKKIDVGTVAAIGVAIGGIGAMVTGIVGALMGLGWWIPVGLAGIVLLISGPSMILAWLKLRQRNLGPILDANGWATNGRAKINVPFGAALTHVAKLPPGSERQLHDPFAERHRPWWLYITLAAIVLLAGGWYMGKLDKYLPAPAKSVTVLGANAPAAVPPSAAQPAAPGK